MRTNKNKLYSIQAPEVECIANGKAHKRYEFGCKASFVTTSCCHAAKWRFATNDLAKSSPCGPTPFPDRESNGESR